jgi:prepilin-type N-terminal cleavage/methylation domain-containing protein/prepilin-type processing-associated H-X9-DG protein
MNAYGRGRHCAFTLVELLVVIVLITVIAAVALPALNGAMRAGRVVKDLAQLRGLQQAHLAYATDHDGRFVDVGMPHGGLANEEVAWIATLREYYDSEAVLHSPLDRSKHWPLDEGGEGVPLDGTTDRFRRTSYGCNNYLSRSYSPLAAELGPAAATDRLTSVGNPANTVHFLIMAFDGDFAGADHVHVENWWISDAAPDLPPVAAANHVQTNAAGGKENDWLARSNYGFVDGHVETLAFTDVFRTPDDNKMNPDVAKLAGTWAANRVDPE